jgi:spermidine synthase
MKKSNIIIKKIRQAPYNDFINLYKEAGWWDSNAPIPPSSIDKIVKGSFCFVGAFQNGKMIGMGRSLSDGHSDAYIQDLVVLKAFRNKGIGKKITSRIIEILSENKIDWIALIAEPGSEKFHQKNGFKKMPLYTPMKFHGP